MTRLPKKPGSNRAAVPDEPVKGLESFPFLGPVLAPENAGKQHSPR